MTSSLLPILPAIDDILFNFAQSDGLSQANQVNSARNQRLTATVVFLSTYLYILFRFSNLRNVTYQG